MVYTMLRSFTQEINNLGNPNLSKYYFKKGNKLGAGRPGRSKSQIETIRRRILFVVKKRIFREKDLDTVTTSELLKFLAQIMPKEMGVLSVQAPQVTYISNIPREEMEEKQEANRISEIAAIVENQQPEESDGETP